MQHLTEQRVCLNARNIRIKYIASGTVPLLAECNAHGDEHRACMAVESDAHIVVIAAVGGNGVYHRRLVHARFEAA